MRKPLPVISVIMSEYGTKQADLKESISSILSQDFTNFEFIIVNDGSPNGNLKKVLEEIDDQRIRVIHNSKNLGLIESLNKAASTSLGEYLVRMDTDDIALPNRLTVLYDFASDHPEYSVIGSRALEFTGSRDLGILSSKGEKTKVSIATGDTLVHPSCLIRKADFEEVGGYPNYRRAEDLGLWCELLLAGKKLYVVEDVLLKYRVNPGDYSKRSLKNRKGEIAARLHYYPRLKVPLWTYLMIVKSIAAGILPAKFVQLYRNKFVLKRRDG